MKKNTANRWERTPEDGGARQGHKARFCNPPLLNAITRGALEHLGVSWTFLTKSSRDSFLMDLYYKEPTVIFGESSFLKVALQDAVKLDIADDLPHVDIVNCIGTPLDSRLPSSTETSLVRSKRHLWKPEFGWITMNVPPVREDVPFAF